MQSGSYVLCVDARWNKIAKHHKDYKNIMVSVQAPGSVRIWRSSIDHGMEILTKVCIDDANGKSENHRTHYEGDFSNAYRVHEEHIEKGSWLGYIFVSNKAGNGSLQLKETTQFYLDDIKLLARHSKEK